MERPAVVKMLISIPADVRGWIEREAELDDRTMNSVVVRALRGRMQERAAAGQNAAPGKAERAS